MTCKLSSEWAERIRQPVRLDVPGETPEHVRQPVIGVYTLHDEAWDGEPEPEPEHPKGPAWLRHVPARPGYIRSGDWADLP